MAIFNTDQQDYKKDYETLQAKHEELKQDLKLTKKKLVGIADENDALESLNNRVVDVKKKELELQLREDILQIYEESKDDFDVKIKQLEAEIETAKEKSYKEGYADGISDGVRKGMDLTKDDRKMMAQIAALSAASHVPEATSMIAKEVASGIAKDIQGELPATTGTTNKKA